MSPASSNSRMLSANQNQRKGRRPENSKKEKMDSELQSPIPRNSKGAINSAHSRHSDASSYLPKDDRGSSDGFNLKDAEMHIEGMVGGGVQQNTKVIVSKREILWNQIDSPFAGFRFAHGYLSLCCSAGDPTKSTPCRISRDGN